MLLKKCENIDGIFLQMLAINFVLSEPGLMAQAVMCPHTIELKFFSANKRLY